MIWDLAVGLDSAHGYKVLPDVTPENLEIGILVGRFLETDIGGGHRSGVVHLMIDLQLKHEHSHVAFVWNSSLNSWVLNVFTVNTADSI